MAKIAIDTSPVLQDQTATTISENMEEDVVDERRSSSSSSSSIQRRRIFEPRDAAAAGAHHHRSSASLGQAVSSYLPISHTQGDVLSAAHHVRAFGSASLLSLSALSISSEASSERGRQRKAEIFAASEQVIAAAKASKIAAMSLDSKLVTKGLQHQNKTFPPTNANDQSKQDDHDDGEIHSDPPEPPSLDAAAQLLGKEVVQRVDTGLIEIMMGRLQLERKQQQRSMQHVLQLPTDPNVKRFTEQPRPREDKNQDGLSVDIPRQQKNHPMRSSNSSSSSSDEEERTLMLGKKQDTSSPSVMISNCRVHTTNSALRELIMTEESYCEDLYTLVHGFLKAIRDSHLISQEHKNLMIRNAFDLYNFQMDFQDVMLMSLLIHDDDNGSVQNREFYFLEKIAQLFLDWAPKFQVYIEYCVNQDKAVEAHKQCLQSGEAVVAFMERLHTLIRANRGCTNRLKLEDYLIMPVQRIFKYGLMLERLQKSTVPGTNIHKQLSKALDSMRKVSASINETKTRMDTEKKTNLFLSRLEADWALSTRFYGLLGCSRLIGTLDVKIGNDGSKAKRLGCALFNSYVILARIKKHDKYEARHWFPLRIFALNDNCADETGNANSWMLYNDKHRVEFIAMCDQEKRLWTDAFRKCISQSTEEYEKRVKTQDVLEEIFLSSLEMPDNAPDSASYASFYSILSRNESHETPRTTNSYDRSDALDSPTYQQTAPSSAASGNSNQIPSPGMRSIGSFSDLREIVTEFKQQRRYQPYNTRCAHIDSKFEEVCFTPILTARAQARNEYEAMKRKSRMGKSTSMLAFTHISSALEDPPGIGFASPRQPSNGHGKGLGNSLMTAVRRKSSMPGRLRVAEVHAHHTRPICSLPLHHQQKQQLPPRVPPSAPPPPAPLSSSTSSQTAQLSSKGSAKPEGVQRSTSTLSEAGGLPRSLSTATMGLARSSSRFIGRMVGRLGTIGTPQRTKRSTTVTTRLSDSTNSLASTKSEAFTTSSSTTVVENKKKSKKHQNRRPPRLCIPTSNY